MQNQNEVDNNQIANCSRKKFKKNDYFSDEEDILDDEQKS